MDEKVALVTGSTSGIGREIALELMRADYTVVINCDKDERGLIDTRRDLEKIREEPILGFVADVSNKSQVERMMYTIMKEFRRIDLLVNNAGITEDKLLQDMTLEEWHKVLEVNLTGTFICTQKALRYMKSMQSGKIINITSVVGQIGNVGQCNYAASKGGVIAFTKSIAKEYAKYGILVNAIAPGFIRTRMLSGIPEKVLQKFIDQTPLKRLGEPSDISKLVKFLASDDANFITGQVIGVNGGLYV